MSRSHGTLHALSAYVDVLEGRYDKGRLLGYTGLIISEDKSVSPADLNNLAKSVNWPTLDDSAWNQRIEASERVLCLRYGYPKQLIGFARLVQSDGRSTFTDGMINPQFQRHGLFKAMIDYGLAQLQEEGVTRAYLETEPGTEAMYAHLGWTAVGPDLMVSPGQDFSDSSPRLHHPAHAPTHASAHSGSTGV